MARETLGLDTAYEYTHLLGCSAPYDVIAWGHGRSYPPRYPTVYSDEMPSDTIFYQVRRLCGNPNTNYVPPLVRWLEKSFDLHREEAIPLLQAIVDVLASGSVQLLIQEQGHGGRYYQIPDDRILLYLNQENSGKACPRCRLTWSVSADLQCPNCVKVRLRDESWGSGYFRHEYAAPLADRVSLLAREHHGQLSGDQRKQFETQFNSVDAPVNVLVCTPTMELGIDIAKLSAVYLRNVPPSPANYAQRQGRAGSTDRGYPPAAAPQGVPALGNSRGHSRRHADAG